MVGAVARSPLPVLLDVPDKVPEDAGLVVLWEVLLILQNACDAQAELRILNHLCPSTYALVHSEADVDKCVLRIDPSLYLVVVVEVKFSLLYQLV